jgi:hypothetical protein
VANKAIITTSMERGFNMGGHPVHKNSSLKKI